MSSDQTNVFGYVVIDEDVDDGVGQSHLAHNEIIPLTMKRTMR